MLEVSCTSLGRLPKTRLRTSNISRKLEADHCHLLVVHHLGEAFRAESRTSNDSRRLEADHCHLLVSPHEEIA